MFLNADFVLFTTMDDFAEKMEEECRERWGRSPTANVIGGMINDSILDILPRGYQLRKGWKDDVRRAVAEFVLTSVWGDGCGATNVDVYGATCRPVCRGCGRVHEWSDILSDAELERRYRIWDEGWQKPLA